MDEFWIDDSIFIGTFDTTCDYTLYSSTIHTQSVHDHIFTAVAW
jgi:hypothetical protein